MNIAAGIHPETFRTRKLSLHAPKILGSCPRENRSSPNFFLDDSFVIYINITSVILNIIQSSTEVLFLWLKHRIKIKNGKKGIKL